MIFGNLHKGKEINLFYKNFERQCTKIQKNPSIVAEELGFDKSMASRWKTGALPQVKNRKKIADYFGITVEELMKEENPAGQGGIEDKEMAALMEEWKNRPDAQRKIIKEHLKGMLDMLEDNHEET